MGLGSDSGLEAAAQQPGATRTTAGGGSTTQDSAQETSMQPGGPSPTSEARAASAQAALSGDTSRLPTVSRSSSPGSMAQLGGGEREQLRAAAAAAVAAAASAAARLAAEHHQQQLQQGFGGAQPQRHQLQDSQRLAELQRALLLHQHQQPQAHISGATFGHHQQQLQQQATHASGKAAQQGGHHAQRGLALLGEVAAASGGSRGSMRAKGAGKVPPSTHRSGTTNALACQVPGCTASLSGAHVTPYFKRHRVCLAHAKAESVLMHGIPMRFCQQCGVMQACAEFDGVRKSCRVQLDRHNLRRRCRRKTQVANTPDASDAALPGSFAAARYGNDALYGGGQWGGGGAGGSDGGSMGRGWGGSMGAAAAAAAAAAAGGASDDQLDEYNGRSSRDGDYDGGAEWPPVSEAAALQAGRISHTWANTQAAASGLPLPLPLPRLQQQQPASQQQQHRGGPAFQHAGYCGSSTLQQQQQQQQWVAGAVGRRAGAVGGNAVAAAAGAGVAGTPPPGDQGGVPDQLAALFQLGAAAHAAQQQQHHHYQQRRSTSWQQQQGGVQEMDPAAAAVAASAASAAPTQPPAAQQRCPAVGPPSSSSSSRLTASEPGPASAAQTDGVAQSEDGAASLQQLRLLLATAIAGGGGPGLSAVRDLSFVEQLLVVDELAHGVLLGLQQEGWRLTRDPAQQQQQLLPEQQQQEQATGAAAAVSAPPGDAAGKVEAGAPAAALNQSQQQRTDIARFNPAAVRLAPPPPPPAAAAAALPGRVQQPATQARMPAASVAAGIKRGLTPPGADGDPGQAAKRLKAVTQPSSRAAAAPGPGAPDDETANAAAALTHLLHQLASAAQQMT